MRIVNDLIVSGEESGVDKLVARMKSEAERGSWRREPGVEADLGRSGIGRLGVRCYSRLGGEGEPPMSLLIYRTGPGELSASSIISTNRIPLTDEQYDTILSDFESEVLCSLIGDLDIAVTVVPPR